MSTAAAQPHPIFTPTALTPAQLSEATVGREQVISRVAARVRDAAISRARRHTLLVGSRGSGKTHTLAVALHRALADPKATKAVALAWIPEDSLSISSYRDLLVEAARALSPELTEQARALRRARDHVGLEQLIEGYAAPRTVVLVVENLDRVFRDLGRVDTGALRAFVETSGRVLVLASTPLLFSGVTSRSEPWYGSFDVERLGELDVAEGGEILRRRAVARGEGDLAAYVMSEQGQARLRAIAHLAGGSPRLWQILADAVTIPSLDEVVPAVEKLLDDLSPYYQQRLWELGGQEQKLVVALGRASGALTVAELAEATGIETRAAATSLGRLAEASWVRPMKADGGDQRKTWYELREPLLRHHLQYRDLPGGPLRVVVEVLRGWYSIRERRHKLAKAVPGSLGERFLATTLLNDPPARSDSAYAARDPDDLLAEVRSWRLGTCTSAVRGSEKLARAMEEILLKAWRTPGILSDNVGRSLDALREESWGQRDEDVLELIAACWNGEEDPWRPINRLTALHDRQEDPEAPFALAIRNAISYWVGVAAGSHSARDLLEALLTDCVRILGADHPDTLATHNQLACWSGDAGDANTARNELSVVLRGRLRALGPEHPDTLDTRQNLAFWTGQTGDLESARDQYDTLVTDLTRILGRSHTDTASSGFSLAHLTFTLGVPLTQLGWAAEELASWATSYGFTARLSPSEAARLWLQSSGIAPSPALRTIPAYQLLQLGPKEDHREWLAAYRADGGSAPDAVDDLAAALDADPEARMRLPAELRSLVDVLRG